MDGDLDFVYRDPLIRLAEMTFGLDAMAFVVQTCYVFERFHSFKRAKMRSSFLHVSL